MDIGFSIATMKLSLISAAAFCLSFSSLLAWANASEAMPAAVSPAVSFGPQPALMPTSVDDAAAPIVFSTEGSAADLTVEARSPNAPRADRAEAFNLTAEQINQNLTDPPEPQENPLSDLAQTFSLPEGMVVRGVNRGGIAIGSELR